MSDTNIYLPPTCRPLSEDTAKQQIRLGIQGFPGTGKNWSILGTPDKKQSGFPNPLILNLDRGLGAHQGCTWIHEVPIFKLYKRTEQKDKIIEWLDREGSKLTENQTLIIDSLSSLDQIYHMWFKDNESRLAVGSNGSYNNFVEWQMKEKWFNEIHVMIKSFRCDIILLCHEAERADKPTTPGQPGAYTGKIRPVLSGKFGDLIVREYTDWFRQHSASKNQDPKEETLKNFRMTKVEFLDMQKNFEGETIYYWQTKGNDLFDAKASSLVNPPTFIPATYESFLKYSRCNNKQTTTK
jgi:hypothetical protein